MPFEKNKPHEYCPDCGKVIIEGKKFCSYCGYEKKSGNIDESKETNKLLHTCLTCNKPVPSNKKYCAVCEIKRIVTIRSKSGDLSSGKYCPTCGKEISSWENICTHCSKKKVLQEDNENQDLQAQLCDKCGNPVGAGKSICPFCGYGKTKKLKDAERGEKKFSSAQYCSKCGEELEAGKETCIFCGYDMRKPPDDHPEDDFDKDISVGLVMPVIGETSSDKEHCKSCGEIIGDDRVCPFCGYGKTKKVIENREEIYRTDKTYIPEKFIPVESDKIPSMVEEVLSTPSSDIPAVLETVLSKSVTEDKIDISHDESVADEGAEVKDEQSKDETQVEEDKTDMREKPSKTGFLSVSLKMSHVVYLSIAIITVFMLGVFGVIYVLKLPHNRTVSATPTAISATPFITPVVVAMDTPKASPSPEPVKESTKPPVSEVKPTPFNVIPTQPLYVETPVIPTAVPTRIPTRRPATYKTPVVTTGYVPSYTPTAQVDYKTSNRTYCDNAINNKVVPLYNERRYSEAIAECNYLLSLDQNYYMNYIWMASCYLSLKDTVDAKYYIDMAWKLEWNEKRTPYEQSESKKLYDWYRSEGGN